MKNYSVKLNGVQKFDELFMKLKENNLLIVKTGPSEEGLRGDGAISITSEGTEYLLNTQLSIFDRGKYLADIKSAIFDRITSLMSEIEDIDGYTSVGAKGRNKLLDLLDEARNVELLDPKQTIFDLELTDKIHLYNETQCDNKIYQDPLGLNEILETAFEGEVGEFIQCCTELPVIITDIMDGTPYRFNSHSQEIELIDDDFFAGELSDDEIMEMYETYESRD